VKAVAYQGVPIQCIPPTNGYASMIEVYLVFILDYVDLIPHCREDSVVLIASSMLLA